MMENRKKEGRYSRLYDQLADLAVKSRNPRARMATIIAVLHHKMDYFFWTGFYLMEDGEMTVSMYQGPVACQILEKDKGVCWAAFNRGETIVVDDVHQYPGHIACDPRSNAEIAVPFRNREGEIIGVLDIDSKEPGAFDKTDTFWLQKILSLVYVDIPEPAKA